MYFFSGGPESRLRDLRMYILFRISLARTSLSTSNSLRCQAAFISLQLLVTVSLRQKISKGNAIIAKKHSLPDTKRKRRDTNNDNHKINAT